MKTILISIVRMYQIILSPLFSSGACRFYPSCSQYTIDALRKHGALKGLYRAAKRISKCHPFHPGGIDPA